MIIDILTLFPSMFKGVFDESIIARAQQKKFVQIKTHNLRNWAIDERGTVDDKPYGGGVGMVLRPEPIFKAVKDLKNYLPNIPNHPNNSKVILLDAGGGLYNQSKAQELSKLDHLILICGHYEGVDFRVHEHLADEVISIGDYVLTGGEIPAMILIDSITRLIPGVLKKEDATKFESFSTNSLKIENWSASRRMKIPKAPLLVEYPQYTRPENFEGHKVPEILLSGHHAEIENWRNEEAVKRTKLNRPDLLSLKDTKSSKTQRKS